MILPLLFQLLILLSWQTNASAQPLALTTKSTYSISIPFPFAVGVYRCIDLWFHRDSIFDMFLRKNIDVELEVHEFSIQENHGYIVKYCRTKASLGNINDEGRSRDCEFGFFLNEIWLESISNSREEANKLGAVLRALGWYKSGDSPYFLSAFDHGYSNSLFPMVKENSKERNTTLPLEIGHEVQLYDLNDTICHDLMTIIEELIPFMIWLTLLICTGIFIRLDGKGWLLIKIKKRQDVKIKMELFKRNGGLLFQKQLSSSDCTVHQCQIFNSDELNIATKYFNVDRELGQGGQGTVYKGILEDGRMVAIKKPKVVDEEKINEFVNEVVILSQINHRNVVKLLGCCLETKVPILVYEFISNGTLFEFLHDQCENIPFTWDMRLRIAIEVAEAVSYLHFEASSPIIHRDIKSTNILLDNRFKAKVADFGISRTTTIHQTHLTTRVQGTLGYLDPEYHQTSQLTDKSDVYSFGIILVELLTGLKPIFSTPSQENINLGTYFLHCMKENCLKDILDARVREAYTRKQGEKHEMKQGEKHEILAFAQIATNCLNMNGRERPTMKEVSTTLEAIRASRKKQSAFNRIMKELIK